MSLSKARCSNIESVAGCKMGHTLSELTNILYLLVLVILHLIRLVLIG